MDKVRLGALRTEVTVTDTDALLHPRAMAQIISAVEAHMTEKATQAQTRMAETQVGLRVGDDP